MNRGFLILAENTNDTNYVSCAETLAYSIKKAMPNEHVILVSSTTSDCKYFDNVISLPHGDLATNSSWKLINDWQVYEASPFEYTIKLEADMYIPTNIDYWWDILKQRDVVVCSTIRNFKNEISASTVYRQFLEINNLPSVYNAITYYKKSEFANNFFMMVRHVFEHWDQFLHILKCDKDELVTTDWVYSIVCHNMGIENTTMPNFTQMSMIHMKQYINDFVTADWTNEVVTEISPDSLKLNTIVQTYPFHYHNKHFNDTLRKHLPI
jgi:hypothetical protein